MRTACGATPAVAQGTFNHQQSLVECARVGLQLSASLVRLLFTQQPGVRVRNANYQHIALVHAGKQVFDVSDMKWLEVA